MFSATVSKNNFLQLAGAFQARRPSLGLHPVSEIKDEPGSCRVQIGEIRKVENDFSGLLVRERAAAQTSRDLL